MADDVQYETQTVRAIRGMESRTITKWERAGWEVVSQEQGKLQTHITIRRPKPKLPKRALIIGGSVVAVALVGIIIAGVISERGDAEPEAGPAPTSEANAPETSEPAVSSEPSEPEPTPTEPSEAPEPTALTIENSDELAAVLTLPDYCDDAVPAFAEAHAGEAIEFDGYIGATNPHDGATTRYDILIGAGDFSATSAAGPTFQFRDVNTTSDLHYVGETPDSIGVGTNLHIVAEVGEYEPTTCLFLLEPVATSFR